VPPDPALASTQSPDLQPAPWWRFQLAILAPQSRRHHPFGCSDAPTARSSEAERRIPPPARRSARRLQPAEQSHAVAVCARSVREARVAACRPLPAAAAVATPATASAASPPVARQLSSRRPRPAASRSARSSSRAAAAPFRPISDGDPSANDGRGYRYSPIAVMLLTGHQAPKLQGATDRV
jgi:hypothetical protein